MIASSSSEFYGEVCAYLCEYVNVCMHTQVDYAIYYIRARGKAYNDNFGKAAP